MEDTSTVINIRCRAVSLKNLCINVADRFIPKHNTVKATLHVYGGEECTL